FAEKEGADVGGRYSLLAAAQDEDLAARTSRAATSTTTSSIQATVPAAAAERRTDEKNPDNPSHGGRHTPARSPGKGHFDPSAVIAVTRSRAPPVQSQ